MATSLRRGIPYPWGWILLGAVALVVILKTAGAGGLPTPAVPPSSRATGSATPSPHGSPDPSPKGVHPPACRYGDLPALHVAYGDWRRTLLDTSFALPSGYDPPGLVSIAEAGFAEPLRARALVIADLGALRRAAAAAGNPIDVVAAYRGYSEQERLFGERVAQLGRAAALRRAARPGHSEHQLGTTLDFKSPAARDVTARWERTPEGAWMAANAWRFGFVMSYPRGSRSATCYGYEPWHFRYMGRAVARRIHASGLTEREYLWSHAVRERT